MDDPGEAGRLHIQDEEACGWIAHPESAAAQTKPPSAMVSPVVSYDF